MTLLDRLKNLLIPEGKGIKKEYPVERQDFAGLETLPATEQKINMRSDRQMRISRLTPREHDLYLLLLEGFTLKESAKQLLIKYSTANTHMTGIYRKLGVNSRAELIINYRGIRSEKTQTP